MATVKKGILTSSSEWWKHLRWRSRAFWKGERRAQRLATEADDDSDESSVVVWRMDKPGEEVWVEVRRRPDGLFVYTEWAHWYEKDEIFGDYDYVGPVDRDSGLFASLDDAKRDAVGEIEWLRHVVMSKA